MKKITPDHYAALLTEWMREPETERSLRLDNLAKWLIKHGHDQWLPRIERSLNERAKSRGEFIEIELTVPTPISPSGRIAAIKTLESALEKRVELVERIDPTLLGGARLRIGDRCWDASLRSHLQQLTHRLTR